MHCRDSLHTNGFTLAEIIVSILLLSIATLGSFKTFHHSHSLANSNLIQFQRIQLDQQIFLINELKQSYFYISADTRFEQLNCLIEFETACP